MFSIIFLTSLFLLPHVCFANTSIEILIKANASSYKSKYDSFISFRDELCIKMDSSSSGGLSSRITFVTLAGLKQTMDAVFYAIVNNIPGDFADFGVWRGGTAILMARALKFLEPNSNRKIHLFDSFVGVPDWKALGEKDIDNGRVVNPVATSGGFGNLSSGSSIEEVRHNFAKYELKDMMEKKTIVFHKGWFDETVPHSKIKQLALIRADAGSTISTKGILAIYPTLVNGGIYIVDDYNEYKACSNVIDEFFIENKIDPKKLQKDIYRPYWIK